MSRRRELPGMKTFGQHIKENLAKRIYRSDGSRDIKAENKRDGIKEKPLQIGKPITVTNENKQQILDLIKKTKGK